ncbi:MAG: glycosyltransferase [Actinomycetota bacterium]|nr:glycosyltransferase [Actinomycetota bacterium]
MNVSVIVTTLNEADTIGELLGALAAQTRPPDEVIVVDGGSADGTLEAVTTWAAGRGEVVLKSAPGANIAAGRNIAISHASCPVIAVTDAGCIPEPSWLEELTAPFQSPGADVVMGFYRADPRSTFEEILSCLNLPEVDEVHEKSFMPSSRSVAFTKSVWSRAGGYPEWLDIGEDMYFNFRLRQLGAHMVFAPAAIVRWRLRPGLGETLRQYFRYARGDAIGGMYPERHALRFLTYLAGSLLTLVPGEKSSRLAVLALLGVLRMRKPYLRASRRLGKDEFLKALIALPALELLLDFAKMAGYVAGLSEEADRRRVSVQE